LRDTERNEEKLTKILDSDQQPRLWHAGERKMETIDQREKAGRGPRVHDFATPDNRLLG